MGGATVTGVNVQPELFLLAETSDRVNRIHGSRPRGAEAGYDGKGKVPLLSIRPNGFFQAPDINTSSPHTGNAHHVSLAHSDLLSRSRHCEVGRLGGIDSGNSLERIEPVGFNFRKRVGSGQEKALQNRECAAGQDQSVPTSREVEQLLERPDNFLFTGESRLRQSAIVVVQSRDQMVRKSGARERGRVHESQVEGMANRERIGENGFPEVPEGFKESDALALQGVSKTFDQGLEIDSRIDFPSFQLLVNVDEQSGRLFRGSFKVGSHLAIVFKVRNR